MIRELFISVYLFIFKLIFNFFNRNSLQNKTVFVSSFKNNMDYVVDYLSEVSENHTIVVLDTNNTFKKSEYYLLLDFKLSNLKSFIQSIYHLATANVIFVDNYYAFLSVTNYKESVECIQLWHAVGALKLFGLQDLTNENRSTKAVKRFQRVYDRFDRIVVGSRNMEKVFEDSFNVKNSDRFLRTGIPRTDFFFDQILRQKAIQQFHKDFPIVKNKKVILYAPTYRENELNRSVDTLNLDIDKMYQVFQKEYILMIRLHPAISFRFPEKYSDFVINVSDYESINPLLIVADLLITDYSSIPFEYALLNKPMIFYTYDLEEYKKERGLPAYYEESIPGPIVRDTDKIIEIIKEQNFNMKEISSFANSWNEFSKGKSTENLIEFIYGLQKPMKEAH